MNDSSGFAYRNLIKLCGVFPKYFSAVGFRDGLKAFPDGIVAVRPRRCCQRKLRGPQNIIGADVTPALNARLIVPSNQEALPLEHFRRFQVVTVPVELITFELIVGIFQQVGAPAEPAFGDDDFEFRKAQQDSRYQKITKTDTELAG